MTETQKLLAEAEALGVPWIDSPFFPTLFEQYGAQVPDIVQVGMETLARAGLA